MREYLRSYCDQGFFVFPCYANKKPVTDHGFYDAVNDWNIIDKRFWKDDFLIGFPTGKRNGIAVIDFDINKEITDGNGNKFIDDRTVEELVNAVEDSFGPLPDTFQVETPSGGRHYYYSISDNVSLSSGRRFVDNNLPIDIRCDGGYVIAPDGDKYIVFDDIDELEIQNLLSRCTPLPEWIINHKKKRETIDNSAIAMVMPECEVREIRSALSYLSSDDRDTWVKVGLALKSTNSPTAFGLWNEWSKTSEKYNPNDMEYRWKTLFPKDISIASLFYEAKKYGWVTTYDTNVNVIIDNPIVTQCKENKKPPFPENLLRPTGLVGDICDYILSKSIQPQPVFALSAALCAIGTLAGRKYQSQTGIRTNIYCLNVGKSGCGKDAPRAAVKELFDIIGCGGMASVDSIASDSAIETELVREPAQMFSIDEMGRFLTTTNMAKTPSYIYNIISVLLRLYSSANTTYWCKSYADSERKKSVIQPHLCLLGFTVPESLYTGLSYESATDGFLSRMMIFETDDILPEKNYELNTTNISPSSGIIERMEKMRDRPINKNQKAGNIEGLIIPNPTTVPMSRNAMDMWREFDQQITQFRLSLIEKKKIDDIYNRASQMAMQLALIVSIGNDVENPVVTEKEMWYGTTLARFLVDHTKFIVDNHMAHNEHEHETKKLYNMIASCGQMTIHEITRNTQYLPAYQRDNFLEVLKDSLQVQETVCGVGGRQTRMFQVIS